MKKIIVYLFVSTFFLSPDLLLADEVSSLTNTRGVLREESYSSDVPRSLLSAGLYLPKQALNVGIYGVGKVVKTVSDEEFIETVKDILYLYERDLLWFPVVDYASGFRPEYGAGLYYTNGKLKSLARFSVHDSDYWDYFLKTSYKISLDRVFVESYVLGRLEKKDDLRYHGIGGDPEDDPRNRFISLTDQDYGVFTQERKKIEWGTSVYAPSKLWQLKYMGFYERRNFENSGVGHNDLEDVFDLTSIPGFTEGPLAQIYNEISFAMDTRNNKKLISPGLRAEGYYGLSAGLRNNDADVWKTGVDLMGFIPVYKENRVLVPRIMLDYVGDLGNSYVPFTEFTRHKTFRGTSDRDWVRSDRASAMYSLEYQWPLTHNLAGHLFVDYVAVGRNFGSLDWDDGIWAAGAGFDLRVYSREIGRLQFSGGSEGFQFKFTVGKPFAKNTRSG